MHEYLHRIKKQVGKDGSGEGIIRRGDRKRHEMRLLLTLGECQDGPYDVGSFFVSSFCSLLPGLLL